ncbi:MAG: NBR1-Ig-like domain-containing protein [Anaerolineales bacterium]
MTKKFRTLTLLPLLLILVLSCNLPSGTTGQGLSETAAAQTISALLSVTPTATVPPLASATFTPSPIAIPASATNTPVLSPTPTCNLAQFITDVTIPDGTIMTPGQAFTKKWRLKNIGACAWNGFSMVFDSGDSLGGVASKPVAALNPGQEIDLDINLTAPATVGNYRGYWRLVTSANVLVPVVNGYQGKSFYVDIKVQNPATATNTSAPAFAVSSVALVSSGSCGAFTATANITANGPGSVTYYWKRSDGATDTTVHPPVVFAAAGTQSVNTTWSVSAAGTYWIDIYIDTPNHQQFGRASFTCP